MRDHVCVNILNNGYIQWINERGPVFGYMVPIGIFQLMVNDPHLIYEETTPDEARKKQIQYFQQKAIEAKKRKLAERQVLDSLKTPQETPKMQESFTPVEDVKIEVVNTPAEEKELDDEIDKILTVGGCDEREYQQPAPVSEETKEFMKKETKKIEEDLETFEKEQEEASEKTTDTVSDEETGKVKFYNNIELSKMTKAQLKQILIDRGHTGADVYAPRYHDTLQELCKKVRKTQ